MVGKGFLMTEAERKTAAVLLDELEQMASDSIGACYGTLSAALVERYVRDIRAGLLVGEPTEEQIERVALEIDPEAMSHTPQEFHRAYGGFPDWASDSQPGRQQAARETARRALAAAGVTTHAPCEPTEDQIEAGARALHALADSGVPFDDYGDKYKRGVRREARAVLNAAAGVTPPAPSEIESELPSCFTSDVQIESKPAIDREKLIDGLRIAMLGTTDGEFIPDDSDIPAGEMFRLAAEYIESVTTLAATVEVDEFRFTDDEWEAFKLRAERGYLFRDYVEDVVNKRLRGGGR